MQKILLALLLLAPAAAMAQGGTIRGVVTDGDGMTLIGANVSLEGTTLGAATTADGTYAIANVPAGSYTLQATYLGYESFEQAVRVTGGSTITVDIVLAEINQALAAAEVFASRAVDRQTPVAYTDIPKEQIQAQLGSRDIPLVLNTAPSVYATENGGGAGDARINVRGFDQRNTAVMINGVPVNDMENGWVYWSNWDGVGDVTTSIQLQRGLSAVNLAVPSVGGTLNILTDPANNDAGVMVQQEVGSGEFLKTTARASTGLVDGKYAVTALGVRKTGNGLVNGTWTDAWAYYLAGTFNVNRTNTVSLYAVGAPQRHGQNLYRQNIAAYDEEFALGLDGYDPNALQEGDDDDDGGYFNERGWDFNQNIAPVSPSYTGQQAVGDNTFDRYESDFLMERENFYHKPQINLNWYSQLSDRLLFSTVGYYSGGTGGGTGTLGSSVVREPFDGTGSPFTSQPFIIDWDATIARNVASTTGSRTIIRNSRNDQNTFGVISKMGYDVTDALRAEVGVDLRTASIDHYREVRDLLGGDYYVDNADDFNPNRQVGFGDKIDYFNNNTVNWAGTYAQAELNQDAFTAFLMGGLTSISYDYEDFFTEDPNAPGQTLQLDSGILTGYTVKTGGLFRATPALGLFGNVGYISKVPIFDGVINDVTGQLNPDPQNEDILAFEAGANYRTAIGAVKLSGYYTSWDNRTVNRNTNIGNTGEEAVVFLRGVQQVHYGAELEVALQPSPLFRIDAGVGIGDWSFRNDVTGTYQTADRQTSIEGFFPIDGLKVGDQPQTQFAYGLSVYPLEGLDIQFLGRTYSRHYASFDAISRGLFDLDGDGTFDVTDADGDGDFDDEVDGPDRAQSWQAPGYSVFDLNMSYELPLTGLPVGLEITGNVFNLLDATYILDATDNSRFNGFDRDHDADDAEVFLGLPRRFNVGLRLTY